jgi:monothiol glutaredoxin
MSTEQTIKDQIAANPILLYMKCNPEAPQCGFSSQATQLLMACGKKFAYVDILANPEIRATLPTVSDWPTFPQLFVNGELVGGCDIVVEMYEKGELQELIAGVEVD